MKYLLDLRLVLFLTLVLFNCESNDSIASINSINGKWKLFEAYISAGGPQYLVKIENGEEFEFSSNAKFTSNGKFTSDKFEDCTEGTFSVKSESLISRYDCDGFQTGVENSNGEITYKISFESGYLVMVPTSVICIEGCSYRYKKI